MQVWLMIREQKESAPLKEDEDEEEEEVATILVLTTFLVKI